jgi:hypothetical protein
VASDLAIEDVGPYSAVVRFATDREVAGVVGFGWDDPVSFASDQAGLGHRIELEGLVPDTDYVVQVVSHSGEEKPEIDFTTEPRPLSPEASVADGRLELDDRPFFPVIAYGACAWTLDNLHTAGVNVFQWEHSCGVKAEGLVDSIGALGDDAYWTVPWVERDLAGEGLIGFTQPDEPDGLGLEPGDLPDIEEPGRVTFMTLTQHFAPGTGDLPWQYPGYYEAFAAKADVLAVDFYPLQSLCSPEKLALNHDVQLELVELAGGKPTIQWIETASMKCPERRDAAITPETLRAEMLLAIAGGANGLGLFPARLEEWAALEVRSTLDVIEQAWPMLMTARLPVVIEGAGAPLVRASARTAGGATMIVVANASTTLDASVDLRLQDAEEGQEFVSVDRSLEASVAGGILHLDLEPLEAHVLVATPDPLEERDAETPPSEEPPPGPSGGFPPAMPRPSPLRPA